MHKGVSINDDFNCNSFNVHDCSNVDTFDNVHVDFNVTNVHNVHSDVQVVHDVQVRENVDDNLCNFTHTFYEHNLGIMNQSLTLPYFPVNFRHVTAPVGGRLSLFYENYELLTDNRFLLDTIKYGYKIKFIDDQPPKLVTNAQPFYLNLPDDQQAILDVEMQKFLDNQVIEECDPQTPGFYSPCFLREKKPDNETVTDAPKKYRVIHDLSKLNDFIVKYKFKMDGVSSVRQGLKQGMYFYSIDISSAYNHVLIHPDSRKYLRCWWKGKCYNFRALPFGLSSAPWIFTSIMSISAKYLHKHAVYSFFYLDDICVFNEIIQKLINEQPLVLLFLQFAGWLLNLEKSHLPVAQRGVYIGVDVDLYHGLVFPTARKWQKLQGLLQVFLNPTVFSMQAKQWARLLGLITCLQDLTPLGRVQARVLQFHLNTHWKPRLNLYVRIPVTSSIKRELRWWGDPAHIMCGVPIQPGPITETMTTDASLTGLGSLWRDQELSGQWTPSEASHHINYLEALCVWRSLLHWEKFLHNSHILLQTDNTTVVANLNKGSTCHSTVQHKLIQNILTWCHQRNILITARHLAGKNNIFADLLSRSQQIVPTEWSMHPSVIQAISLLWETPHVDLFATRWNNKLPVFISPVPDSKALAVDALTYPWTGLVGYAFPPFAIVPQVLRKISQEQCIIYLIAPCWPRQAHFPLLLDLSVDIPRKLPLREDLLTMPKSGIKHPKLTSLNLHVFKLSNMVSLQESFQSELQTLLAKNTKVPPLNCMKFTGNIFYLGVNSKGLRIPSRLLYLN